MIDFVQTQTTTNKLEVRLRELDKKYEEKVKIYTDSHPTIPISRIVPFVFTSDGVLHPKTEEFMDWFICKAASTELIEPPSHEKISFRHAFLASLQDKTAFLITSRFEQSLKEIHATLFPHAQQELFHSVQYSEPLDRPSSFIESQPTPSPPPPHFSPPSPSHPLAPQNPSSRISTRTLDLNDPLVASSSQTTSQRLNPYARTYSHPIGSRRPPTSRERPSVLAITHDLSPLHTLDPQCPRPPHDTHASTAQPSVPQTPNDYARAYTSVTGARRGHPPPRTPPSAVALQHRQGESGETALPAPSSMGVLFRGHLSRDGRRA